MRIIFFSVLVISVLTGYTQQPLLLTDDGAWCWFSDPRAIYSKYNKGTVITGWINKSGDVYAASLQPATGRIIQQKLYPGLEIDDHDNPAFLELADGNILTQYTWHSKNKGVVQNITSRPGDVQSFESPLVFKPRSDSLLQTFVKETYTYANPLSLSREQDKLYCFGRWIGFKPNFITSADGGRSWSEPKVIITSKKLDTNNRPYVKYYSDGQSKIHLLFTDGHPNNEPLNSVYYCYYEKDAFWRADGSLICTVSQLPFHPEEASVVYKADAVTGKAWIFDIAIDKKGRPVVAYTRYPDNKQHLYHYAVYHRGLWLDHLLINSGGWFPQTPGGKTEREQNYSGGMCIDPLHPETVYFSHQVNGVFEISKASTKNKGKTWKTEPVTQHSVFNNVRPVVPRYKSKTDPAVLLWMRFRHYTHYTEYDSDIVYKVMK